MGGQEGGTLHGSNINQLGGGTGGSATGGSNNLDSIASLFGLTPAQLQQILNGSPPPTGLTGTGTTFSLGSSGGSSGGSSIPAGLTGYGTLTGFPVSNAELNSLKIAYTQLGYQYGYKMTTGQINELLKYNVSPNELQSRFEAVQSLTNNKVFLDQYETELRNHGMGNTFSYKDRLNFIMGQSPAEFYRLWEGAAARTTATQAGLTISGKGAKVAGAGDTTISGKTLGEIIHSFPSAQAGFDPAQLAQGFAQSAQDLLQYEPQARLRGHGISKQDIVKYDTGTLGNAKKAAAIEQLKRNVQASQQNRTAYVGGGSQQGPMSGGSEGQ